MHTLPCTTVAGRHAAALRRQRARTDLQIAQDLAREAFACAVSLHGLTVYRHFEAELGPERSLWIDCRVDSCAADHRLVYALLDEYGWQPDRTRLSRTSHRYDIVRLRHGTSDATLVVIIKLPVGGFMEWEAA